MPRAPDSSVPWECKWALFDWHIRHPPTAAMATDQALNESDVGENETACAARWIICSSEL